VEYTLPFINVNFRSTVRVIDFFPDDLKDFSIGQRATEYDILSDYSGGEDTDPREDTGQFRAGTGYDGEKVWSWRFALLVEDASRKATKDSERMWLLVDNSEGQMLLSMEAVK
jgi:protection of telomeres protein 1